MSARSFLSLVLCLALALPGLPLRAQDPDLAEADMPVRRIVLYSSGVGYFQHGASIDGDKAVELRFTVDQVQDILKSLVVMDAGGSVGMVSYPIRDPLKRQLRSFGIDLTGNPSMYALLEQLRGVRVEVQTPEATTGTVLAVEQHQRKVGDGEVVTEQMLVLLTDAGMKRISLDTIVSVKILNERLQDELQKALTALAAARDTSRKPVRVEFRGDGRRDAMLAYVIETPVWKTSYRLVLDDDDDDKPYLQGWAIVENTTESDWTNVDLALASGRPVSFAMDLYQPLYAPRPDVAPMLVAGVGPRMYDEGMEKMDESVALAEESRQLGRGKGSARRNRLDAKRKASQGQAGFAGAPRAPGKEMADMDIAAGVSPSATGARMGALFRYDIDAPVNLQRQKSAMLPILAEDISAEQLSIYNQSQNKDHPMAGLWLENSTDLHLMAGPITVLHGQAYAGDALIDDLPPGDKRLVSYAMDLEVTVQPEYAKSTDTITALKAVRGTLRATRKHVQTQTYGITNKAGKEKPMLIEHPIAGSDWTLIEPDGFAEKTDQYYRFRTTVPAGKKGSFKVVQERITHQSIALVNMDIGTLLYYAGQKAASDELEAKLKRAVKMRRDLAQAQQELNEAQRELQQNKNEQTRLLNAINKLDRNLDIYQDYLRDLNTLRDKQKTLEQKIDTLKVRRRKLDNELKDFLEDLSV